MKRTDNDQQYQDHTSANTNTNGLAGGMSASLLDRKEAGVESLSGEQKLTQLKQCLARRNFASRHAPNGLAFQAQRIPGAIRGSSSLCRSDSFWPKGAPGSAGGPWDRGPVDT
jgi:hypothetical protein